VSNPNPLSTTLRQLRQDAGISGSEAARRAGLSQSKVSRAETGVFLPNEEEVKALCRVYGAPAEVRRHLIQMTRDLHSGQTPARAVLQRGGWWMQERIGRLEAAATTIRTFTPAVIIGLVQSRAYVRALFGDFLPQEDLERTVDARLARQRVLDSDRQFVFVMAEGALRWHMGSPAVMAEQLEHLIEVSHRDNIQLGIIPWTTPAQVAVTNGFTIYDSRAVLVGTQTGTAIITDRRSVDDYEAHWGELSPLVSWDDEARSVINRVAEDYRTIA